MKNDAILDEIARTYNGRIQLRTSKNKGFKIEIIKPIKKNLMINHVYQAILYVRYGKIRRIYVSSQGKDYDIYVRDGWYINVKNLPKMKEIRSSN
jgi:hypothetical protein